MLHLLGEGSFGAVYLGLDKITGQQVAVKKVSKKYTKESEFQSEVRALMKIRDSGGHPNICGLRENFSEEKYHYFVLDLVEGIEMFDYLVSQGAYSEADAARLVREVASAICFLHGIGISHGDLKPENLMLSSKMATEAVVKLIDFGCAQTDDDGDNYRPSVGKTLAYSPPEMLRRTCPPTPSADVFSIGVILYIMLTGVHPFDLTGKASDEQVAQRIKLGKFPLRGSPITAHLSDSAVDLIECLMQPDPKQRLTANEMLNHPWTRGITAREDIMEGSGQKLSKYRVFKSGISQKVFSRIVEWSDESNNDDIARQTSLIERSFRSLDPHQKGYLTQKDLHMAGATPRANSVDKDDDAGHLSLSDFSSLLAEHMQDRYFPVGSVVYKEDQIGESMYFLNSGTVSVDTKSGTSVTRGPGDFFGEGALFHPNSQRSATITCLTPVHVIEIQREYFEKYLEESSQLFLTLREKDKIRKRNRAKMVLWQHKSLTPQTFEDGEIVFKKCQPGDSLFLVEEGTVAIEEKGLHVFTATPGNVFGEYAVLTRQPRNCTAVCANRKCVLKELGGQHVRELAVSSPDTFASLRDLCLRRDFKKAVVHRLQKEFPYQDPRQAFEAIKGGGEHLTFKDVLQLMQGLNPEYNEDDIHEILGILDLTKSGSITFDEFCKVFVADIRKSASI